MGRRQAFVSSKKFARCSLLSWMTLLPCPTFGDRALQADELVIPAFTAYSVPDHDGIRTSEERGADRWSNGNLLRWFGNFHSPCKFQVFIDLAIDPFVAAQGTSTKSPIGVLVRIGEQVSKVEWNLEDSTVKRLDFGRFEVDASGFHSIELSIQTNDEEVKRKLRVESLVLDGVAKEEIHFNLKERRNAASVHLQYHVPDSWKVDRFYVETTAVEDPVHTFYMACGFRRGYFGMQVNSPAERRIIFSVWDAGKGAAADDRSQVDQKDLVHLLEKGADVHANDFGGEGTGGHSHLKYRWKTGERQRFLLIAEPVETSTEYAGYYFHPDQNAWVLISRMLAPSDGKYLEGLHSFSENFWGSTGNLQRKVLFDQPWVRTADGVWHELTEASFSHDATGKQDRLDRFMGIEGNAFFLSHGGFIEGTSQYGEKFHRAKTDLFPEMLKKLPTSTSE